MTKRKRREPKFPQRAYAEGGQVEPVLASLFSNRNWSGVNVLHVRQLRSALWVYRSDRKI